VLGHMLLALPEVGCSVLRRLRSILSGQLEGLGRWGSSAFHAWKERSHTRSATRCRCVSARQNVLCRGLGHAVSLPYLA